MSSCKINGWESVSWLLLLLEAALKKAGSLKQEKMRDALRQIELPNTIDGLIKFDEAGRNVRGKPR